MPMISSTIAVVRTAPAWVGELAPADVADRRRGDEERIDDGDAGAFRRGEDAGAHAAEDDGDQSRPGMATAPSCRAAEAGEGFAFGIAPPACQQDERRDHQRTVASSNAGMMPAVNRSAIEILPPAEIE